MRNFQIWQETDSQEFQPQPHIGDVAVLDDGGDEMNLDGSF